MGIDNLSDWCLVVEEPGTQLDEVALRSATLRERLGAYKDASSELLKWAFGRAMENRGESQSFRGCSRRLTDA